MSWKYPKGSKIVNNKEIKKLSKLRGFNLTKVILCDALITKMLEKNTSLTNDGVSMTLTRLDGLVYSGRRVDG